MSVLIDLLLLTKNKSEELGDFFHSLSVSVSFSPPGQACRKGHSDVVELLLRNGADTKIRSNFAQTAKQFALRFQPIQLHNMLHDHDKR